jgi:hypothetical protein
MRHLIEWTGDGHTFAVLREMAIAWELQTPTGTEDAIALNKERHPELWKMAKSMIDRASPGHPIGVSDLWRFEMDGNYLFMEIGFLGVGEPGDYILVYTFLGEGEPDSEEVPRGGS